MPPVHAGAATPLARYGMSPYAWAKYTARINKQLTPQMLTQFCGFTEGEAARMIRRLTFENVLMAPDAGGVSRTSGDFMAGVERRRAAMKRMMQTLRDEVQGDALPKPEATLQQNTQADPDPVPETESTTKVRPD